VAYLRQVVGAEFDHRFQAELAGVVDGRPDVVDLAGGHAGRK
jgi:hypothetical protein